MLNEESNKTILWLTVLEQLIPKMSTVQRVKFLDELNQPSFERFQRSLKSIERSKYYLEWLFSVSNNFTLTQDKENALNSLLIKESACEEKAHGLGEIEKEIAEAVDQRQLEKAKKVNFLYEEFIQRFFDQITVYKMALKQEIDLGSQFFIVAQQHFRTRIQLLVDKDPDTLVGLAKTLKVMQEGTLNVEEIEEFDSKYMFGCMNRFNQTLETRQDYYKHIIHVSGQAAHIVDRMNEQGFYSKRPAHSSEGDVSVNRAALGS